MLLNHTESVENCNMACRHEIQYLFDVGKHKGMQAADDHYLEWILKFFSAWWKADVLKRSKMKQQTNINVHDLLSDLKSCSRKRDLREGRKVHKNAVQSGYDFNIHVAAALINMYVKCGSMTEAQRVFDGLEEPSVVSWSALILGYVQKGQGKTALELFSRMKSVHECAPNSVTYLAAIKACTSLAVRGDGNRKEEYLERGREIHSEIGCHLSHFVQSTLIEMYAKCGSMVDAQTVFDSIKNPNVVSCTVLILGYADNGQGQAALDIFSRMEIAFGCSPDSITYIAAIKACTSLAADGNESVKEECLKRGREIHSKIGQHMDLFLQSTLINMYAKCGSMEHARKLFYSISKPDVVSWNALILGYADNGEGQVALDFFSKMEIESRCAPNSVTYVAALQACGSIGALAIGRKLHSEITNFDFHAVTCLVDFYAKCGSLLEAREVFDLHSKARNTTTWNALLVGYGSFGDIDSVFDLFQAMQNQGFWPDVVTFVCMLSTCSRAGMVEKAREYLETMHVRYGVTPTLLHYSCMIDVFGRANQLEEAFALLRKMPCNPDTVTWMALLSVCRKWNNVELGRLAFQALMDLDEKNAAAHVLMAQIYGSKGMWEEQERVLEAKRKFGAWKISGKVEQAYVMDELGKIVKFVVGENDPPEFKDKLKQFLNLNGHGYLAELRNMSVDAEKEEASCGHSERRAVMYGIMKAPFGEHIKAFKNMRMCDDCHRVIKISSKLSQRVIIVRDVSRFHVMENGNCACGEYW